MAQDRYLWPGMGHDIKCYIKTCTACKQATSQQALACQASWLPDWVDLLQNRPQQPDQGGKIIRRLQKSLMIDRATCYPVEVPLWSTETTKIWWAFETHGIIWSTTSNNLKLGGTVYLIIFARIVRDLVPAYHPEANVIVEHWNTGTTLMFKLYNIYGPLWQIEFPCWRQTEYHLHM